MSQIWPSLEEEAGAQEQGADAERARFADGMHAREHIRQADDADGTDQQEDNANRRQDEDNGLWIVQCE